VCGSTWSEAAALQVQIHTEIPDVKRTPKPLLSEATKAKAIASAYFRDVKTSGMWHELPQNPMVELRRLLTGSTPCVVVLKANFRSPMLQALDHAISIPIILQGQDATLCLAFWISNSTTSASWRSSLATLAKQDLKSRMIVMCTSKPAKAFAEALADYMLDCSPEADMVWEGGMTMMILLPNHY